MSDDLANRRPLKTRATAWATALASALGRAQVAPDLISACSVAFAVLGCVFLGLSGTLVDGGGLRAALLVLAALCIQLRLLCNMLDGMVAVEHRLGGPAGPIWNELPDRIADVLFLVGAGYAAGQAWGGAGAWMGWLAGALAVLTAYVRELGRGLGFDADFSGPMAKPHRMAALTVTCIVAALEPLWGWRGEMLLIGLTIILLGSGWTVARRTRTLARRLKAAQAPEPKS